MANPLLKMMSAKVNPAQMIQGLLNSNPQQMLMNLLQKQNPNGYQQLQQLMNSGQDPNKLLNQMLGNLSPQQTQQLKELAGKFGIRY